MTKAQIDAVIEHPMHYNRGKIEVWDFIADHRLDYLRGNVVKYVSRAGFKDAKMQDLLKAKEYLKKAMSNTTYVHEMIWPDYTPSIDPTDFAQDQGLSPALAAVINFVCQWELGGAMYYLNHAISAEQTPKAPSEETKPKQPTVYGTDEKKFEDPRKDRRVFEFGKRIGARK